MHLILQISSHGSTESPFPFFPSFSSFIKKKGSKQVVLHEHWEHVSAILKVQWMSQFFFFFFFLSRGGIHSHLRQCLSSWKPAPCNSRVFFYSFHKSSYNHCSLAAPQPYLLFVRRLLGLLNWHVRPVKTAPRKQHIPDESFNGGFTYQSDEK